ncbi:hypothetical protein SAMN04488107_2661 [Geodermatophilus saharensis]|uniref:Lipoprotein n=1 Tax=Geodermatophilus saharensis TaxID=1137994 RepID=A0A239EPG1_9ACTN|nr:hypothetical protein [Geodermatophilus saharensis]SNS46128.1 hypothetical protein SAMN04488107_2661 [Geodermatophilus saharensis]
MRQQLRSVRAGVVTVLGVVLLTSCSGDEEGSGDGGGSAADTPATSSPAEETTAGDDFCTQAEDLDQRVETALEQSDRDESIPDVFRQLAEEMQGITAPDAIAADWDTMRSGLERMADAVADLDLGDADSVAALEDAGSGLEDASDHVETYLRDECGIG